MIRGTKGVLYCWRKIIGEFGISPTLEGWYGVTGWMYCMHKIFSLDFKYKGSLILRDDKDKKLDPEEEIGLFFF